MASKKETARALEILLVEDSPGFVRMTEEAMAEADICNKVHSVGDGVEALAYLRREGPHARAPRPDIVLLDLNLPRKDGREVLAEIRQDPDLKDIPVAIMTISQTEPDMDLDGDCFITKPANLEQFITLVHSIEDLLVSIAERRSRPG